MKNRSLDPDVVEANKKSISDLERESKWFWRTDGAKQFGKTLRLKGHKRRK